MPAFIRYALLILAVAGPGAGAADGASVALTMLLRPTLFPEKDNVGRLTAAGRREVSRRRAEENRALRDKAEGVFKKTELLRQMNLIVVPQIHDEPDPSRTADAVNGEGPATMGVFPRSEWEKIRQRFPNLAAFEFEETDGRGGTLYAVYRPALLKTRLALLDRVEGITEAFVDELLTRRLGLHPAEGAEIARRIKEQVREAMDPRNPANRLSRGKDIETQFVRGMAERFVRDHLAPDLTKKWTGHDPARTETLAHKPGERELASSRSGDDKHVNKNLIPQ